MEKKSCIFLNHLKSDHTKKLDSKTNRFWVDCCRFFSFYFSFFSRFLGEKKRKTLCSNYVLDKFYGPIFIDTYMKIWQMSIVINISHRVFWKVNSLSLFLFLSVGWSLALICNRLLLWLVICDLGEKRYESINSVYGLLLFLKKKSIFLSFFLLQIFTEMCVVSFALCLYTLYSITTYRKISIQFICNVKCLIKMLKWKCIHNTYWCTEGKKIVRARAVRFVIWTENQERWSVVCAIPTHNGNYTIGYIKEDYLDKPEHFSHII